MHALSVLTHRPVLSCPFLRCLAICAWRKELAGTVYKGVDVAACIAISSIYQADADAGADDIIVYTGEHRVDVCRPLLLGCVTLARGGKHFLAEPIVVTVASTDVSLEWGGGVLGCDSHLQRVAATTSTATSKHLFASTCTHDIT
jgi:hypothetical protein